MSGSQRLKERIKILNLKIEGMQEGKKKFEKELLNALLENEALQKQLINYAGIINDNYKRIDSLAKEADDLEDKLTEIKHKIKYFSSGGHQADTVEDYLRECINKYYELIKSILEIIEGKETKKP